MKIFIFKKRLLLKISALLVTAIFLIYSPKFKKTLLDSSSHSDTATNQTTIPKPAKISYRNAFWQVHKSFIDPECSNNKDDFEAQINCRDKKYEEVVVYSSFFDNRPSPSKYDRIQVLAVLKIVPNPREIYCQIWLEGANASAVIEKKDGEKDLLRRENEVVSSETSSRSLHKNMSFLAEILSVSINTGRNHHFKDVSYGQRQYSCSLEGIDPTLRPSHVSLTFGRGERSTIFLPVEYPKKTSGFDNDVNGGLNSYKHEFVVCVVQAFGGFNSLEIIEWIELHQLLGVTKINVYNGTMRPDPSLESVFHYYEKDGLLSFYSIPPAVVEYRHQEAADLSSAASLNDCMMRYMNLARWIIIVDFDEIILPVNVQNYSKLIKEIENEYLKDIASKDSKSSQNMVISDHDISFPMVYFFKYFQPFPTGNISLLTSKYRIRTRPLPSFSGVKSFINPRTCLSVFNHYCYRPLNGKPYSNKILIKQELAVVQHYRIKCPAGVPCPDLEKNVIYDTSALRFQNVLQKKVKTVSEKLSLV